MGYYRQFKPIDMGNGCIKDQDLDLERRKTQKMQGIKEVPSKTNRSKAGKSNKADKYKTNSPKSKSKNSKNSKFNNNEYTEKASDLPMRQISSEFLPYCILGSISFL